MDYMNTINLAFDKPLEYKKILLYPATLPYYSIFSAADECLDINKTDEKNIDLLRLPYLEYIYEKSLVDEDFKSKWQMLILILNIVLKEDQPFDILRENGKLIIKVYQRSETYDLFKNEYNKMQKEFLDKYKTIQPTITEKNKFEKKLNEIKNKMYDTININSQDFEEIRKIIMIQNDIKVEHYDAKTEAFLYKMKEKLRQARSSSKDQTDMEDLITILSYMAHIKPEEMYNMTIRRFNRYLNIVLNKDDYYMYKQLELSGMIKLKSDLPHWIKHYEPKGRFDDILVSGGGLLSSFQDGGKI